MTDTDVQEEEILTKHERRNVTTVITADDVTDEVLALAARLAGEWPAGRDKGTHWGVFWRELDGTQLADGSTLDLGGMVGTEAMSKIKEHVL